MTKYTYNEEEIEELFKLDIERAKIYIKERIKDFLFGILAVSVLVLGIILAGIIVWGIYKFPFPFIVIIAILVITWIGEKVRE